MCLLPLPALSRQRWSTGSGDDLLAADEATCEGDDGDCDWDAGGPFLPGLVLRGLGWGFVLPLSMEKTLYSSLNMSNLNHIYVHTHT